jgi:Type IV secretion system pilin
MNVFDTIEFSDIIRYAIALIVIFAALAAILYTIWGGFLMILSGGAEEKVKWAVNHIRHALIGIGFIILVLFIFPVLMNLIGLPYGEYAKPSSVFQTIGELSDRIFGLDIGSSMIVPSSDSTLPSWFSDL